MASSQSKFDTVNSLDDVDTVSSGDKEKKADASVPAPVVNIILEYVSPDPVLISGGGSGSLVNTLFNSIKLQRLARLRTLLTAIVQGQPDEAKKILEKDPTLLDEKLEEKEFVTSRSGHKFNLKPYHAALSVGDTQMADMVKSFFTDEKEADRQFEEQCPKRWEELEDKKWSPIFEKLDNLVLIIGAAKADITSSGDPDYILTVKEGSLVETKLNEFWSMLDATLNEVITVGKWPFNRKLLLKALQVYGDDKNFETYFGNSWTDPRALLFVQKIIGYEGIQRLMPDNDVQAWRDGLENTVGKLKKNEPQGRSTEFEIYRAGNWLPVSFYPLKPRKSSMGSNSSVSNFVIYGGRGPGARGGRGGCVCRRGVPAGWRPRALSNLMSIKNSSLTKLKLHRPDVQANPLKSSCRIM
ncbi:MAG: hypothetical protein ABI597_13895 [Gammaproteobacteria bacterium]